MRPFSRWLAFGLAPILLSAVFALGLFDTSAPAAQGAPPLQTNADPAVAAIFTKAGCIGCHTIPGIPNAVGLVGPNLSKIGAEGATRKSGMSAPDYIRESILNPGAFIAPSCPPSGGACPQGVMPPNMGERLSAKEIEQMVDYLASLAGAAAATTAGEYVIKPIAIVRPPETANTPFANPPRKFKDAEVLLGKYLFFDARLAADSSIACASCHQPDKAWTDGKPLSDGYPGTKYFRNTPSILNAVFASYAYWDGRLDPGDMPTVVRDHITEAHFYQADGRLVVERLKQVPEYVQLFKDAYGAGPSFGRMVDAVSAYVLSLNSSASAYDKFLAGDASALSTDAKAGLGLFNGKAGCAKCHTGNTFSDSKFYALGVPENPDIFADPLRHITFRRFFRTLGLPNYRNTFQDVGLLAVTEDPDDRGAFRTAPLREVARTAPYMHNGMLATLDEVVRFYNQGVGNQVKPLGLSDSEIAQIVAFLSSLNSALPVAQPVTPPAYQLRKLGENK
ncbi:MAG: c-type cytochrome [Chloroflexi bacterium]|nr:c-type cytochrome [Chloroflexota bacterium]